MFLEIVAFQQNWTRKHEEGHSDLIPQPILFMVIP